jgi:glycosyltransferase involved in cell wall biosynthesis
MLKPTPSAPLVSIIVPVYNAEKYLRHCVDSILGQSHENLEVILVDDGAKDSSPVICDEYAVADSRVKVIHQANGGIAKAQNAGLDAAHGAYIAFADNDDILNRSNIELLLHALESTGADMSKGRWRQFGVSQLEEVKSEAATGADSPKKITVFRNPLRAYQTVFCKSLRLLGSACGRNTEARYFNEANWCRLYRRELWDGLRFPEGMYAQDVMVAGELYSRMDKVADIDVNLYNWLQSADSVTHKERSFGFYHDNTAAGIENFRHALEQGVTPGRSYYTMVGSLAEELSAPDAQEQANQEQHAIDKVTATELLSRLTPRQRVCCFTLQKLRLIEKHVYDARIKNMQ